MITITTKNPNLHSSNDDRCDWIKKEMSNKLIGSCLSKEFLMLTKPHVEMLAKVHIQWITKTKHIWDY